MEKFSGVIARVLSLQGANEYFSGCIFLSKVSANSPLLKRCGGTDTGNLIEKGILT